MEIKTILESQSKHKHGMDYRVVEKDDDKQLNVEESIKANQVTIYDKSKRLNAAC
jgi:hypothetical protein